MFPISAFLHYLRHWVPAPHLFLPHNRASMSAASLVTCLARPSAQQRARTTGNPRMAVQCQALSFHAQPHNLTGSSASYSSGMGQQYSEGPSCDWPQAESHASSSHNGVWAMLSGLMVSLQHIRRPPPRARTQICPPVHSGATLCTTPRRGAR